MYRTAIRSLFAFLLGGLLFLPFAATSSPDPMPEGESVDAALKGLGYTIIPLRKTALNEYEMEATINGSKKITVQLNFQMTSTLLDLETMKDIGMTYDEAGQEFQMGGDKDDLYVVRTDSINIGDGRIGPEEIFAVEFDEFDVLEDSRVGGILGREFLIKHKAIMDFAEQKLYIRAN